MTPASNFLFALLRSTTSGADSRHKVRELAEAVSDWDELLFLTRRHGLFPQLYQFLKPVREAVPPDDWQTIQTRAHEIGIRNLRFTGVLREVAAVFEETGIRAIPYKGPVLAQYAYGDLSHRQFGDLDILVCKGDIVRARRVLLDHGYDQLNYSTVRAETMVESTVFRWGKEFRFGNPDEGVPVELRFEFLGGRRSDAQIFDDLWHRRESLSLADRPCNVLSPNDRVLLLLVHGTKHGWRRLSWVYDIGLLLERDIDWGTVLERAKEYGWQNAVVFGIAVSASLTGGDVPPCIRREIASTRRFEWSAALLAKVLRTYPKHGLLRLEPLSTILFLNDGVSGSVAELIDVVASPRKADFDYVPLPPHLHAFYYLVRPYRLGRDVLESLRTGWSTVSDSQENESS